MSAPLTSWVPSVDTFGARLALVRWRMGWNVKEAAVECGLPPSSWANWESGKQPRDYLATVNRIVLRTRVDRMWLMTGEGSPEPSDPNLPEKDYKFATSEGHVAGVLTRLDEWKQSRAS